MSELNAEENSEDAPGRAKRPKPFLVLYQYIFLNYGVFLNIEFFEIWNGISRFLDIWKAPGGFQIFLCFTHDMLMSFSPVVWHPTCRWQWLGEAF